MQGTAWRATPSLARPRSCRPIAIQRRKWPGKKDRLQLFRFWLRDLVHLQCDRSLREQPAVDRCMSLHGDQRIAQDDSLEVRGCSQHREAGNLPEYVLGQRAALDRKSTRLNSSHANI